MTIQAAIETIDALKANLFTQSQKIKWLSDLDGLVWREIMLTHEGIAEDAVFPGYNESNSLDIVLLVPEPYTDIYKHYMAAQMDITNRETGEYSKDMLLFNNAWQTYADYYNRHHVPRTKVRQLRF